MTSSKNFHNIPDGTLAKLATALGAPSKEQMVHLVELGRLKKDEKRSGVTRSGDTLNLSKVEAKALGIHPNEAALISRREANKIRRVQLFDKTFRSTMKMSEADVIDQLNAIDKERKEIDFEWSSLNNQLMDDFYADQIHRFNKEDIELKYYPPIDEAPFPYSAGQWMSISIKWGVKNFDNSIHPFSMVSPSKNRSIVLLMQKIQETKEKHPVPFDPMKVHI